MIKKKFEHEEEGLIKSLVGGNVAAFERVYQEFSANLYAHAYNILRNKGVCEEIVQETFYSLWTNRENLQITHSLQSYLFTAVKFRTLNYIKSEKVRKNYAASYSVFENLQVDNSNEESIHLFDLKVQIEKEVLRLPEKCQRVFRLSRNEHQSIQNIAESLGISHKTVENQLTKALKQLRASLGQYLFQYIIVLLPVFL